MTIRTTHVTLTFQPVVTVLNTEEEVTVEGGEPKMETVKEEWTHYRFQGPLATYGWTLLHNDAEGETEGKPGFAWGDIIEMGIALGIMNEHVRDMTPDEAKIVCDVLSQGDGMNPLLDVSEWVTQAREGKPMPHTVIPLNMAFVLLAGLHALLEKQRRDGGERFEDISPQLGEMIAENLETFYSMWEVIE